MNKKDINTVLKCKKVLSIINKKEFICFNCNSIEFYKGIAFEKICKSCKSKSFVTQNTIFHNIRFGIVKAFEITIDYYNSNYNLKSVEVSNKYKITQKTAWIFLKKIRNNKDFVEILYNYKKPTKFEISIENKLKIYISKN
jgi:hypothetical protein